MIAFKTYSQIPESQRPVGVPLDYPAIAVYITQDQISLYQIDHTVLSDEDYDTYVAERQPAYDSWLMPHTEVPKSVTNRQIREALVIMSYQLNNPSMHPEAIASFIKTMPSGVEKDIAWQNWEYSNEFLRSNPLISQMAPLLGLTQSHLDQLFISAGSRQV